MRRLLLLLFLAHSALADAASAIDEYFTRLTAHGFSGAVLVARGEEVLLRKGYGSTDRYARGAPNRSDTAFNIASLDKQFIAAGILRLEEMGKLKTSDPLARFFPNAPDDKKQITLHQVLTHTAGFPDEYWDSYETLTRSEFIEKILAEKKLIAPPGTEMSYASFDYWLLEEVIERASGMPFEAFLRRELFDPLGMQYTGAELPKWNRANVARSTLWTVPPAALEGEGKHADPIERPRAWRVLVSTADDLYKWYLALRGGRVLNAESRRKLFTPGLDHYAYGWYVVPTARGTTLVHHGGGGSFGSVVTFRWFRDEDVFFTILNNSMTGFHSDYVGSDIEALLFNGACVMPPPSLSRDDGANGAGKYRLPLGGTIDVVRVANGPLVAVTRDPEGIVALHLGGTEGGSVVADTAAIEKIPARFGAFRDATTMHHRTLVFGGAPEVITFTKVRFEKGDAIVRAIHDLSGSIHINQVRMPPGAEAVLAPSAGGGYTTWEPRMGSAVRIHFSANEMRMTGGAGTIVATRVNER